MWPRVEIMGLGVSLNASLMGMTYATLACETLRYLMGVGGGGGGGSSGVENDNG